MYFPFRYLFERQKVLMLFTAALQVVILILVANSYAEDTDGSSVVRLITPTEGAEIIEKKPSIQIMIEGPFSGLVVGLDGIDVTGMVDVSSQGLIYRPLQTLPPGMHVIYVGFYAQDGSVVEREFSFSSRHTKTFEQASSDNTLSATYTGVLKKPDDVDNQPYSRIDANLNSSTILKEKAWQYSLNTNIRFFDMSLPVYEPEKKGISLINYLLTGQYTGERSQFVAELGDVQVDESEYTVQGLAKRGGKVSFKFNDLAPLNDLTVNAFSVDSRQLYGYRSFSDGFAVEGDAKDHIMGISADAGFLSNKARFKTIYATGGEEGDSFGISSYGGDKKGDVLGFVLHTDFFEQKLKADAEAAFSKYDPDTSDNIKSERDKSYKLSVGGYSGNYSYGATYYYIGPEFAVIGNQGIQNNLEGIDLNGSARFDVHSVTLTLKRSNDNIAGDKLFAKTIKHEGGIDYTFSKFQHLPMGIGYQKTLADGKDEPDGSRPFEKNTDTFTGRINYMKDALNLGLQAGHSIEDDRTASGIDTYITTYSFTSAYTVEHFSVSPAITFNRTRIPSDNMRTDNYLANLHITGDMMRSNLNYDLYGSYNITRNNNGLGNNDVIDANFEITYMIAPKFLDFLNPAAGIRGQYIKSRNESEYTDITEDDEFIILLILETSMPFSI